MPAIDKDVKVLVSGANGFLAMWVVRILLERGFTVRGTVRSADKGKYIIDYFTLLGYGDKINVVVVEDITKDGAFDEAITGIGAIVHVASPCRFVVEDPLEAFLAPTIQGTLGILKSAVNSQVQRIVITSSVTAIGAVADSLDTIYTELDFNEDAIRLLEQLGKKSPPALAYMASKTLAEKRAWEFYEEHKSELQWDLTVIHPSFNFGPSIQEVRSVDTLSDSMKIWASVLGENPKAAEDILPLNITGTWVDVRDCALSHVLSLEKSAAGGERFIILAPDTWTFQDWADTAKTVSPGLSCTWPAKVTAYQQPAIFDNSKQEAILGVKFRTKLETTKDILDDFAKRGWTW